LGVLSLYIFQLTSPRLFFPPLSRTDVNITANVVLPSVIDTPGNREAMGEANAKDWVSPQSLAEVICFLAGEGAKDLRGAAIPVYGSL